jgi:hypothetical protein
MTPRRTLIAMLAAHALDLATTALGLELGYRESMPVAALILAMGWPMVAIIDTALVVVTWGALGVLHPLVRRPAWVAAVVVLSLPVIANGYLILAH